MPATITATAGPQARAVDVGQVRGDHARIWELTPPLDKGVRRVALIAEQSLPARGEFGVRPAWAVTPTRWWLRTVDAAGLEDDFIHLDAADAAALGVEHRNGSLVGEVSAQQVLAHLGYAVIERPIPVEEPADTDMVVMRSQFDEMDVVTYEVFRLHFVGLGWHLLGLASALDLAEAS